MMNEENNKEHTNKVYEVNIDGSLGLLAYGDLGLRAWREVKLKNRTEEDIHETK